MQIEQALSGLTYALFCTVSAVILVGIAVILLHCLALAFITTARALWVRIRRDMAELSMAISGKTPRKATVSRIENGRKKFPKVSGEGGPV